MHLRGMTQTEFEHYLGYSVREYGARKAEAGMIDEKGSFERAQAEYDALLPAGLASPSMLLFTAVEGDEAVGMLWLGLADEQRRQSWVFDIRVHDGHRGKGYGRAIMQAAERELVERGIGELGLNVFGHNRVARQLYDSLGYEVVAQQMVKRFTG